MRPKRKLLLVSANEERAGILRFVLETHARAVTVAATAAEARELLAAHTYDLLLCQWPVEDVAALADLVHDANHNAHALVLAPQLKERPEGVGAAIVMTGNYCTAELLERIKCLCACKRGPLRMEDRKPVLPVTVDAMMALAERRTA